MSTNSAFNKTVDEMIKLLKEAPATKPAPTTKPPAPSTPKPTRGPRPGAPRPGLKPQPRAMGDEYLQAALSIRGK